ncbi:MAG: putative ABC transporter permease [Acutalibacter sp.]
MLYTYLWCFFLFAFLGWCSEVAFAAVRQRRFVNRGFLNGPLCPIYGLGVVGLDFLLRPFAGSLAVLLVGSMLVGSALEYVAGFLLEKLFHQKWWDYSNNPHNLHGYICLKFSVLWGVAGALVVRYLTPFTRELVSKIPTTVGWVLLIIMSSLLLVDFLVTAIGLVGLNRKLKNLEYVSSRLRQGSDRLGEDISKRAIAFHDKHLADKEALQKDWQREALRLKEKYEHNIQNNRLRRRLLKAFPDLQLLKYNEQLEEFRQNVDVLRRRSWEALRRRNEDARAAYETRLAPGEERPFAFGLCYDKLFWIFMVGNVAGFVLETLYALATTHRFQVRVGLVFGPFIPVYGLGAVVITLLLSRLYNQKDIMIFLASMFIGGGFEYICSFVQQSVFGTVSWEYSDSPLNIGGRTNLMFSFFWGILGLLWVKDLYPAMSRIIQKVPKRTGRTLTVIFTVLMAVDILLSIGAVYRRSERVNEIPATNPVQVFFDQYFPDSYLDFIFPHMQYVGKPEIPTPAPDR